MKMLLDLKSRLNVMDVGAAFIAEIPVYKKLLDADIAHLHAFEGDPRQATKIQKAFGTHVSLFSDFLADGSEKTLYVADSQSGMTSLLKPDVTALKFFNGFDYFGKIISTETVKTKRLDDVQGVPQIDFLKLDIQGSELDVLRNGTRVLSDCLAVQLEVSYICLYENQPPFGEVDIYMRSQGYVPHCFLDVKRWSITPTVKNNNFRIPFNQLLESDIVYIKNPMQLGDWADEQLKKMIVISHYCFASFDLSVHLILELMRRKVLPDNTHTKYVELLK